ncbi:hypothetical protein BX265_6083 [Streptomyces sp. TLI_235]|nr:hypothetical protein BX265_6083 [Streptomyces sp. TLI_235]
MIWAFVWIAAGYLLLTLAIGALFGVLERRAAVSR